MIETPKLGEIVDLQFFYDSCLPGNSLVLNTFDEFCVNTFDLSLNSEPVIIDMSKKHIMRRSDSEVYLKPILRTAIEPPRRPGLIENLLALIKRNFNSPDLAGMVDYEYLSQQVCDSFFSKLLSKDPEVSDVLNQPAESVFSEENFSEWLAKQEPATVSQLANMDYIDLPAVNEYRHMIKRKPKAKLDLSLQSEYPALQTIVYHSKHVNAIFGPIFSMLTGRLLSVLDSEKFRFFTRLTPQELEDFFKGLPGGLSQILELDISKFDKSQARFHFEVEMRVWERLGIDEFIKKVWENGHKKTILRDYTAGIKTIIEYQRKSGDVTTFIGNTIIIAACLCSILPVEKSFKAAFCGDDSILYLPSDLMLPDIQERVNNMWNFEAKLFKKKHGYFCGRYVLQRGSTVRLVPDPLKIVTKLGTTTLRDWDHVEEFRVSLFDLCHMYKDFRLIDVLESAVRENFPNAEGCKIAFCCIYKYLSNKFLFRTLFEVDGESGRIRSRKDHRSSQS